MCCCSWTGRYSNLLCLQVIWAVQALVKQEGWLDLPLYALGASSGGALALMLALRFPMQVCFLWSCFLPLPHASWLGMARLHMSLGVCVLYNHSLSTMHILTQALGVRGPSPVLPSQLVSHCVCCMLVLCGI